MCLADTTERLSVRVVLKWDGLSSGGGATAEFGFQRTRAAREGAIPAGMTASV